MYLATECKSKILRYTQKYVTNGFQQIYNTDNIYKNKKINKKINNNKI